MLLTQTYALKIMRETKNNFINLNNFAFKLFGRINILRKNNHWGDISCTDVGASWGISTVTLYCTVLNRRLWGIISLWSDDILSTFQNVREKELQSLYIYTICSSSGLTNVVYDYVHVVFYIIFDARKWKSFSRIGQWPFLLDGTFWNTAIVTVRQLLNTKV